MSVWFGKLLVLNNLQSADIRSGALKQSYNDWSFVSGYKTKNG